MGQDGEQELAHQGRQSTTGPGEPRRRTITWVDPRIPQRAGDELDGLALLRGLVDGTVPLPPMAALMGFHFTEAERGRVVAESQPEECHYNPNGTVHGGFAATILDSVMGCAIHTHLAAGVGYGTIDLAISYVRAITSATGPLRAEGRTIHVGGRIATAEGRLTDATGRIYATATTTCLITGPTPKTAPNK